MQKFLKYFVLIAVFVIAENLHAQNSDSEFIEKSIQENDITEILPPLSALMDSAEINSPLLKMIDADIAIQQLRIKVEKKNWLSYIGVDGSVRYGLFDNLILKEALGIEDLAANTTTQTRYSVGVYFKIPFTEILNTEDERIAENEKVKLLHQRSNTILELRKLVILQYNNIVSSYNKLIIRTSALESRRIQDLMVDKQFKSGQIGLDEYTRQKDFFIKSKLELEENKVEFLTAIQILQETVGIKLKLSGIN